MEASDNAGCVLVVDDSPEFTHLLNLLLTKRGYRVLTSNSSDGALVIAESDPPDLFLLDINMPDMNGYELCAQLKSSPALKNIPVIFVSGYDDSFNKVEAFDVGAVDYINKPIHAEELGARVKSHVELYRLRYRLQQEVAEQTMELQDTLTALRVLVKQQTENASETEKMILNNLNIQVIPFVKRLQKTRLDESQENIVDMLISNLQKIAEPLIDSRSLLELRLTPVEIQIANMIKEGKKTKEIANVLCLSELTISTHRKNIRKKLDIGDRKVSLYTFISTL